MVDGSYPPYLFDLAPCDLFFILRNESGFEWKVFADTAEVQWESLAVLDSISTEDFRQYFQQREQCWDHCIQSEGEYFEGD